MKGNLWRHEFRAFVAAMVISMALKGTGLGGHHPSAARDPFPWWAVPLIAIAGYAAPGAMVGSLVGTMLPLQFDGGEAAKETGA